MGYATIAIPNGLVPDQLHAESSLDDFSILPSCRDSRRTIVRVMTLWKLTRLATSRSVGIEVKSTTLPRHRRENFSVVTFVTSRTITCEETG